MRKCFDPCDLKLREIQIAVSASSVANLRLLDKITDLCRSGKLDSNIARSELLPIVCDSTKILAKGYAKISATRKRFLQPLVSERYQPLCEKHTFGKALFGDDLQKEVRVIDDETKIMKSFSRPPYRYDNRQNDQQSKNYQGRGRGQFRPFNRGGRPFRGRGRGQFRQQNRQNQPNPSPAL